MTKTNIWAMIEWLRAGLLLQALLASASRPTRGQENGNKRLTNPDLCGKIPLSQEIASRWIFFCGYNGESR